MAIESLIQDIRYAIRGLRRTPLFTASVAGTIGLGLGILCSAFTIVNAYLFKPIDLRNPHELYALNWGTAADRSRGFTLDDFNALGASPSPLSAVAAAATVVVTDNAQSVDWRGRHGQLLQRDRRGHAARTPVAPGRCAGAGRTRLSWCFRTKRGERTTHRIRQIVGREITLSGQPFTVVGVTKPGQLLPGDDIVAFWVPLTMANAFQVTNPWQERADPSLAVIGRRADGRNAGATPCVVRYVASAALPKRNRRGTSDGLASGRSRRAFRSTVARPSCFPCSSPPLRLVLLVACANVMNMMLARGLSRQRELGVRLSLVRRARAWYGSWSSRAWSWRFRPPRSASRSR